MTGLMEQFLVGGALRRWIGMNRNLLLVRRRMKEQLPSRYRREFYRTWVLSHLGRRRKQLRTASDTFSPLTIKISPTMRCNLRCLGCFAGNYAVESDMPFETMASIVAQAVAMGIPSVGIIGGEPLLAARILDLLREYRNVGFYIATNGTLVDSTVVEALKDLPHVITAFSVDGFEATNDRFRGQGVFRRVVDSMRLMRRAGLAFGFSTTVHRGNLADVVSEEYLDFMVQQGCLFGAYLPYVPVGSAPQHDLICGRAEVDVYYDKLDAIGINKALLILKEGYSDGTFLNSGCAAGHTLHLTEGGEAEPCNGIEFCTRDIHSSTLQDIFMSEFFQDIRGLHPKDHRECLVVARPEAVLEAVKRHRARSTHAQALEHLEQYAAYVRGRGPKDTANAAGTGKPNAQTR